MSRKKTRDGGASDLFASSSPALGEPESSARRRGLRFLAGIDEAGRGPLAGPVVAACVALPEDHGVVGLDDSKKLTAAAREALAPRIREAALAFAVIHVEAPRIDTINILAATKEAMVRALDAVCAQVPVELVFIDGNERIDTRVPQRTLVGGDALSECIAAASILAKVERDAVMCAHDATYPQYGFAQHKGYGTAAHYEALRRFGPTPLHRRSFRGVLPPEGEPGPAA